MCILGCVGMMEWGRGDRYMGCQIGSDATLEWLETKREVSPALRACLSGMSGVEAWRRGGMEAWRRGGDWEGSQRSA